MNETLALLSTRRSVGVTRLHAPAPTDAELDTILGIASRVPDHGKVVPWRFIVIQNEGAAEIGNVIAAAYAADHPEAEPERLEDERQRLRRAPLVVAVVSTVREHPKVPEWEQVLSAGAACMSVVIAANALGYATNWLTQWYAYDRRVLNALGLASSERIAGFIHIGTAAEQPSDRPRPSLSDVVTRFRAS